MYECVSTYDKVKKESFNKQVCIGKQSPDGKFIPNARYREIHNLAPTGEKIAVSSKVIGTTAVLSSIADTSGLARCLTLSFGKQRGAQLLAFAEYLLVRGNALSHFSAWASSQKLPLGAVALSSQETSKFLSSMQVDEMEKFYGRWAQNFTDDDTICMDLTSVSSYSAGNELVKYGYNRDKERLEQVNILGLFSASKMLPVAVRMLPGNISDVTTLVKELVHFSHLGLADPMLMMDKGFDSEENRNCLLDKRIKFLMMSDSRSNLLKDLAEKHRDTMRVPSKMFFYQEDRYYATTELLSLGIGGTGDAMPISFTVPALLKAGWTVSMKSSTLIMTSWLEETTLLRSPQHSGRTLRSKKPQRGAGRSSLTRRLPSRRREAFPPCS